MADFLETKIALEEQYKDTPLVHICEVCGKTEILTPSAAFEAGWDYPPMMGAFGIISPRTCPNCPITKTTWWALNETKDPNALSEEQRVVIERIINEPASILPGSQRPNDA